MWNFNKLSNVQLEWLGSITGLFGAFLVATHTSFYGYGFLAFFLSNIFWLSFARKQGLSGLLMMQLGFTATSLLGLFRWLA